ncbi:N-acetylglucosamine-6-phosphate deacetylase [Pseudomonadota bacterium]
MIDTAYINGKVLAEARLHDDLTVITSEGRIAGVQTRDGKLPAGAQVVDLGGDYLLPGFIDTQVNGGGGVLFNESPNVEGIRAIAEAHQQFGTTGLLPTLISDDLEVIRKGVAAVDAAMASGVPGVLGIHIEGPFLSRERRGVHDASKLRTLTAEIISELQPLGNGCSVLTLAPETLEPGMIRELSSKGFRVCAGHSNAEGEVIRNAIEQGLCGFTHLFNAMSQLGAREPGVVGTALDSDAAWCGIIVDQHHVSPPSVRVAYRCKGPEKLMLVTDAMPPVGSDDTEFTLLGKRVTVKDGVCRDTDGTLAGTALDMSTALRNMIHITGCGLPEASLMASNGPAEFLGLQHRLGRIEAGLDADLLVLDPDLRVQRTIIGGREIWAR